MCYTNLALLFDNQIAEVISLDSGEIILREFTEIVTKDDGLVIKTLTKKITIEGESARFFASKVLPLLRSGTTYSRIFRVSEEYKTEDVSGVLEELKRAGVIREQSGDRKIFQIVEDKFYGDAKIINKVVCNSFKDSEFVFDGKYYAAQYKPPQDSDGSDEERLWGLGVANNEDTALKIALYEAFERYSNGSYELNDFVFASKKQLGERAINPEEIVKFSDSQHQLPEFPLRRFSNELKTYWIPGNIYPEGEEILVPIDLVIYPLDTVRSGIERINFANSSGSAARETFKEALLAAVIELIERDAFMIFWLNKLVAPEILQESLPQAIRAQVENIKNRGFDVYIKEISLDLLPVIFVVAFNRQFSKPAFVCGAGAHFDPEIALSKAINEIESSLYYTLNNVDTISEVSNLHDIFGPEEHGAFYFTYRKEIFDNLEFFKKSSKKLSLSKMPKTKFNSLSDLANFLRLKGLKIISIDITQKDLIGSGVPIRVVKAFMPGLIPISFGFSMEPLGMERIYRVPQKLNAQRMVRPGTLNSLPHPFT